MGVGACLSQHTRFRGRTRLSICSCSWPSLTIKPVKDRVEKFLAICDDLLERNASAFNICFIHVNGNRGDVADLLGTENCAGNKNGAEGEQNGFEIPFHSCYRTGLKA